MPTNPDNIAPERFLVTLEDGTLMKMPLLSRFEGDFNQLHEYNGKIRRVVVGIHGSAADIRAEKYWKRVYEAAEDAGKAHETLIIAPDLLSIEFIDGATKIDEETNEEIVKILPNPNSQQVIRDDPSLLFWTSGMFTGGLSAKNYEGVARAGRVSIMEVLNQLLRHVTESEYFPNLRSIVVVGQSGGGNTVSRFAAAGLYEPNRSCLSVKYVPMNAAGYLYFSNKRCKPSSLWSETMQFEIPTEETIKWAADLAGETDLQWVEDVYNMYEFGFKALDHDNNKYLKQVGAELMRDNFQRRNVWLMAGALDAGFNINYGSQQYLQGLISPHRAQVYRHHLMDEGIWDPSHHKVVIVPAVGHDGELMMKSPEGLATIFPPIPFSIRCSTVIRPLVDGLLQILIFIYERLPWPPRPPDGPPGPGPKI